MGRTGTGTAASVPVNPGDSLSMRMVLASGSGSIARPRVSVEQVLSTVPWFTKNGNMSYEGGGNVGIGLYDPGEALSVNGTVESRSGGFRFPDGSLRSTAFAEFGAVIPPGSVSECHPIHPAAVAEQPSVRGRRSGIGDALFDAIGTAYGVGDGTTTFALRDYRGFFLRGVRGSSGIDIEADDRTTWLPGQAGGNVGNAVVEEIEVVPLATGGLSVGWPSFEEEVSAA